MASKDSFNVTPNNYGRKRVNPSSYQETLSREDNYKELTFELKVESKERAFPDKN